MTSKKFEDLTKMDFESKDNDENNNSITDKPKRDLIVVESFDELDLNDNLKASLMKSGYKQMTKIQKNSIPVVLNTNNVLIKSETGSGKTLAYAVPMINHLLDYSNRVDKIQREQGTFAIIFSPTRELCLQIENTIKKVNPYILMVTGCIMGGESVKKEKARIRKGINILICTPGRLLYHLNNTKSLKLDKLQYLIFDESDRILDMGFEKEMTECLQGLKYRNSSLFIPGQAEDQFLTNHDVKVNLVSATLGAKINNLSQKLMKNETRVGFDLPNEEDENKDEENLIDLKQTIPNTIEQYYMKVPNHKFKMLYLL